MQFQSPAQIHGPRTADNAAPHAKGPHVAAAVASPPHAMAACYRHRRTADNADITAPHAKGPHFCRLAGAGEDAL